MNRMTVLAAMVVAASSGVAVAGRVEPELADRLRTAGPDESVPVIVRMARQGIDEIESPDPSLPRAERRRLVTEQLQRINLGEQEKVMPRIGIARSAGRAAAPQQLWLVNAMALEATPDTIEALASDPAVESVGPDRPIHIVFEDDVDGDPEVPPAVEGIRRIRAPQVWALGFAYTGFGAIVGSIDTGVKVQHNDLEVGFRGGANSWLDRSAPFTSLPDDENGHGTHTTGTAVGGNRVASNYIGAAPGAKWIACQAFGKTGGSTEQTVLGCMNWMANPDGNPWTDDLPDVVNNSWGLDSFSCNSTSFLRLAVEAWRMLDIVPVFAAGNGGIPSDPAMYPESLSVGALNRQNQITPWSGRGPSPCDGRIYPKFVAPGTKVRSAWPGGIRKVLTGTSMATPHVTGTVALLRGRNPNLTVDEIERILKQTARDLGPGGPDNAYGFGLIDAYRAMLCVNSGAYQCGGTCP